MTGFLRCNGNCQIKYRTHFFPCGICTVRTVYKLLKCVYNDKVNIYIYFCAKQCVILNWTFSVSSKLANRDNVGTVSSDEMAPNCRQALTWTNWDRVRWRIYAEVILSICSGKGRGVYYKTPSLTGRAQKQKIFPILSQGQRLCEVRRSDHVV